MSQAPPAHTQLPGQPGNAWSFKACSVCILTCMNPTRQAHQEAPQQPQLGRKATMGPSCWTLPTRDTRHMASASYSRARHMCQGGRGSLADPVCGAASRLQHARRTESHPTPGQHCRRASNLVLTWCQAAGCHAGVVPPNKLAKPTHDRTSPVSTTAGHNTHP